MYKRISLVFLILILIFPVSALAQGDLKINKQTVEEGRRLNLFAADLEAGKIVFSLRKGNLKSAEITFDGGRNWQAMESEGDYFVFGYRPLSEEVITPEFLLTNEDASMRTYKPNVRINYQKKTPDEAVQQVLEKMKMYYEQENADRFIDLFSSLYPDRVKFKEAIQNDFYNYKNMRLRYRIDRRAFDEDYAGAIWDVYWERKGEDRNGTSFSDANTIAMRLVKENIVWLISGMRDNTIFGSSLLESSESDLTLSASDISGGYVGPNYVVSAVIHNNGSASANNFKVRFQSAAGFDDTVNVSTVAANSQTTVNYTTPGIIPPFTVTVTADSAGTVTETDETNNSASKSL